MRGAMRHLAVAAVLFSVPTASLDNGLALRPPMGFNSWMSGMSASEATLTSVADFFVSSGLRELGFTYVNGDDGWCLKTRGSDGELVADPKLWPSGVANVSARLHAQKLKLGIYGAATGVTCQLRPGQLYNEEVDAKTYAEWGVDYLKSDTCASYAIDSSLRFGAMRDALNRTGRPIVLSIEPFSMNPDPAQSVEVSNLARVATDIGRRVTDYLDRADISDKWSPLARPGYFNDPDMMPFQQNGALGTARTLMGLWSIMKAPLLLSARLPELNQEVLDIIKNDEVIALNQDALGVQARKLSVDGAPLPWLLGLADCSSAPSTFYSRGFSSDRPSDTRSWTTLTVESGALVLKSDATGRCVAVAGGTAVLLPCNTSDTCQQWRFDKGTTTVSSVTSVCAGQHALAVGNETLFSEAHAKDAYQVSDVAYGRTGLVLVPPYQQNGCPDRNCQNYDPSQMWYYSPTDRKMRHATYTASINHKDEGRGYVLTQKVPTWRHHCLAHVLSNGNFGTASGSVEVWGGPLSGGAWAVALLNRGTQGNASIAMKYSMLEAQGLGDTSVFKVRSLWDKKDLGEKKGGFEAVVPAQDIAVFRLSP